MPNHVSSKVTISGPNEVLLEIEDTMNGETPFDFQKLIPMPAELKGTTSPVREPLTKEQKKLVAQFGACEWYSWCCQNWGVKWPAYDVDSLTVKGKKLTVQFITAWDSPKPIFQEIVKRWPSVKIKVKVGGEIDYPHTLNFPE